MPTHRRTTSSDVGHWEPDDPEAVFDRPAAELSSEDRLRWAVLADAVGMIAELRGAKGSRRERRQAAEWVLSSRRDHLFAFEALCEHFGIDGPRLRRKLQVKFDLDAILATKPSASSKVRLVKPST